MVSIYFDTAITDDARRSSLYQGDLYVYSPRRSVLDFARFAQQMIEDAFHGFDPEKAQYEMPAEQYADILMKLKPAFIHHSESKRHVRAVLEDFGCDPEMTYFEVPKMRSATSDGYLTAGIAYAWHPHRDTWYSAAPCQINWWFPVYELETTNAMAFHPQYWSNPIANSSSGYCYYEWNQKYRGTHIKAFTKNDPRPLPAPTEPVEMEPQIRLLCPVGGILVFSAAHLHSSVPNTSGKTRWSIDFRTVHAGDLEARIGAPNIDSQCSGTALFEFKSVARLEDLPANLLALYEDGTEIEAARVYSPDR